MPKSKWYCLIAVLALFPALVGCEGERPGSVFDQTSADGRLRLDGKLIRSYDVTLEQSYDSIIALAKNKNWLVRKTSVDTHTAEISVKSRDQIDIQFSVWAPANMSTDIGIKYSGGDKIGSIQVFEELERILPGKRITVNLE